MPRTVLVVDDSAAFRASARRLLEARGYEVVGVAGDVASGLAKARELQPDCVLMDVNLPDGDGITAAGELDGPAVVLRHRECGATIEPVLACPDCGKPVHAWDLEALPGPGTAARLAANAAS